MGILRRKILGRVFWGLNCGFCRVECWRREQIWIEHLMVNPRAEATPPLPATIEFLGFVQVKTMRAPLLPPLAPALLAASVVAFAQQPITTTNLEQMSSTEALALAPQWLLRGTPRQRAWAAYWVGRDRRQQLIPDLLDVLGSYEASAEASSSDWSDDDQALLVVLDALILLNAEVDPDSAGALYPKFPVLALVLLAHSREDARGTLLGILDSATSRSMMDWLAAADLLAANPPPDFAARLLREISIHATVQVLSPGEDGVGHGCAGDCAGSLGESPRSDWPPVGSYRLSGHPESGSELLAPGENPVYFVRTVTRDYSRGSHPSSDCAGWDGQCVWLSDLSRDLIGQLLGMKKDKFALWLNPGLSVTWSSEKAYVTAATAFVDKQEGILHQTEASLEGRGLLTGAEAGAIQVPFEVEILDVRSDKTPLPDLVFADPSIMVTYQMVENDTAN